MEPTLIEIKTWACQAGKILRDLYGKPHQIHHKGLVDLVTEADHQSEEYLLAEIRQRYASHRIITEESGLLKGQADHCWYIDPLDGTINYAHNVPLFSVSIGYAEQGQLQAGVVYNPMSEECFSAERGKGAWLNDEPIHVSEITDLIDSLLVTGFPYDTHNAVHTNLDNFNRLTLRSQGVRRLGSAALDLSYVAAGRLDGYWEIKLSPWDLAAGVLIVEEAGGVVTNLEGDANVLQTPYSVLAANPAIYPLLLAALHEA
ncbi:MAG: inositol monophosphatase family protein [Anaerolineaceae bacterium]|nr:inositol monophosphatase family protein [Anaerolineaceae bacterium]